MKQYSFFLREGQSVLLIVTCLPVDEITYMDYIYQYIDIDIWKEAEMVLTKKVMILFDSDKYKKLKLKARLHKKSVGALIRDTIEEVVLLDDRVSKKKRMEAAKRIVSADEKPVEWEEIEKLIAQGHAK